MSIHSLEARLRRIEATMHSGAPHRIAADRPMTDDEAADALADWRAWAASGRASVSGSTLWVMDAAPMSADEWAARHVTAH